MKTQLTMMIAAAVLVARPLVTCGEEAAGGKWTYRTYVSKIDDTASHVVRVEAEEPIFRTYNRGKPSMIVRFRDGELEVYMSAEIYLGGSVPVRLRKNSNAPVRQTWSGAKDGKAIFSPTPEEFAAALLDAERIVMEFEPYGESPITVEFDTRGFVAAAGPLLRAYSASRPPAETPASTITTPRVQSPATAARPTPTPNPRAVADDIARRYRDPMNPNKASSLQRLSR